MSATRYMTRRPQEAVVHGDGTRHCAWCGDYIDPIDWCLDCQAKDTPCGIHKRFRKRADAAYCDSACRSAYATDVRGDGLARVPRRGWW